MAIDHRILRLMVAFAFGLLVAYGSYTWITDTQRPERRALEESVVLKSRAILQDYIASENLEISDPLERVRAAGKVYVFPTESGWELSGHYRRQDEKIWHDFLLSMDHNAELVNLYVNDAEPRLRALAASDPKFSTAD